MLRRLDVGGWRSLVVREESHDAFALSKKVRLLFISDIHLGSFFSSGIAEELRRVVEHTAPDLILLGGDYVDTQSAVSKLSELITDFVRVAPVYAVSGNHDQMVGVDDVRSAIELSGGNWIEESAVKHGEITLSGSLEINKEEGVPWIYCAHDPALFPEAMDARVDLMFAGHLHGGQVVLFERENVLYPAALVYPWNRTRYTEGETTLIVSRGVTDTIPVRWNCPREVILCTIS